MTSNVLKRERAFLCKLFFLSLIVRLLFFVVFTRHGDNYLIHFDSAQYLNLAQQIADGNGITNNDGTPQFYRLPGYSLFLAGVCKCFGNHHVPVLLLQLILASLIPVLIFLLANMLFPAQLNVAKISSLIAAVHVGFVLYAGMIATETLFTLFFLGFLFWFFRGSAYAFFLSGVLLGFASLIRPVGHYVLVLTVMLCVLVIIFERKNVSVAWIPDQVGDDVVSEFSSNKKPQKTRLFFMKKIYYPFRRGGNLPYVIPCLTGDPGKTQKLNPRKIIFLLFGWLAIVSWWLVRNYLLTGFIFFHTLPGLHFLQYSATKIVMETDNCSYVQARKQLLDEWEHEIKVRETEMGRSLNEYEKCRLGEKLTCKYLKQNPIRAIKNAIIEMAKTCCALYSAQIILSDTGRWPDYSKEVSFWSKVKRFLFPEVNHGYLIPIIYWDIIVTLLVLLGAFSFIIMSLWDKTLFFVTLKTVPFIGLMVGVTLAYGCARLRFPIEPLLLILASYWWILVYEKGKEWLWRKI